MSLLADDTRYTLRVSLWLATQSRARRAHKGTLLMPQAWLRVHDSRNEHQPWSVTAGPQQGESKDWPWPLALLVVLATCPSPTPAQSKAQAVPMIPGPGACTPSHPSKPCVDSWICVDGAWEPESYTPAGTACSTSNTCVSSTCNGAGTCTVTNNLQPGTMCRAPAGACDAAEVCPGNGAPCPADKLKTQGEVCRPVAGPCDVQEACSGTSSACPADLYVASNTPCRTAISLCDVGTTACTGTSASCPAGIPAAKGTWCRAPTVACDVGYTCTGTSLACPAVTFAPAGTRCFESDACACDATGRCVATLGSREYAYDSGANFNHQRSLAPGATCSTFAP